MKNFIFLLFFGVHFYFSQPSPPPSFKVEYINLSKNKDSLLKKFDFSAFNYKDFANLQIHNKEEFDHSEHVGYIDDKNVWIYIYSEKMRIDGNLFKLSIKNRLTGQVMSIYIRNNNLSRATIIENLNFVDGDYFYDFCQFDKKYHGQFKINESKDYSLVISNIRKHKICLKKLNKFLGKYKCE